MDAGVLGIAGMRRIYGESFTIQLLTIAINDLTKDINAGKNMSASQVLRAAELLQKKFYMLNIYDFRICFDRIRLGEYGKFYDVFDVTKLGECLDLYLEERCSIAENRSYEAHQLNKQDFIIQPSAEEKEAFYASLKAYDERMKKQEEEERNEEREKQRKAVEEFRQSVERGEVK